jgi:cell division protein FtsI/penicillin-binding protein 2
MRPSSTVRCPSQVNIGGRIFHNDEQLGTTSLQSAFAVSCNSTFAMLATQRPGGPDRQRIPARAMTWPGEDAGYCGLNSGP